MTRKDCDNTTQSRRTGRPAPRGRRRWLTPVMIAWAVALAAPVGAQGGSVRLSPMAVVVDDSVRLGAISELRGFDESSERALRDLIVASSPRAGGSRVLHMEMIRSAIAGGGTNMASVTLKGATQCAVSRPSELRPRPAVNSPRSGDGSSKRAAPATKTPRGERDRGKPAGADEDLVASGARSPGDASTLRRAVIDSLNAELSRYGGRADVVFDRTSETILDLSGPTYSFEVRRRGGSGVGLVQMEVEVLAEGRTVQVVPLVVRVVMRRRAVIARRSINQGGTIHPSDLDVIEMSFTRLDKLGIDNVSQAIGQRAKRFMPAGTLIGGTMLEPVPLVLPGQLVTLTSRVGGVKVTTSAKAAEAGLLGAVVKIRAIDDKRVEFDAVVVGPGAVRVGSDPAARGATHVALGGKP